jgi:RNA polymerase sigma-70 factor (ECF subfamily)
VPSPQPVGDADEVEAGDAADRAAVRRVLDGDVEAFAPLVGRHGARLLSLCARLVGSRAVGEELAQEALARAFVGLGAYRDDGSVRSWLFRIALNGCRDYLKSGARREGSAQVPVDALVTLLTPERELAGRRMVAALARGIASLPPPYREAFVLFHVEGLPYREMRAVTGARVNALKVRVHRAREMLRQSLAGWFDDEAR